MSSTRIVLGTCHHDCPDSCGWQVTVDDGRAVQLRGNPAHPYSQGELCPKVNRFLDRVYSPDRVLHPLRRVGAKGEGRFEQISWDEALAHIATRLHGIVDEHGPEAILPYVSAGNQSLLALMFGERFWHHLGASRVTGALCGAVAGAGTVTTLGNGKGIDPSDMRHSKLIILWGTNTRLTNRHLWPFIEEAPGAGRAGRRHRPAAHHHRRLCRLVPAAAARHRRGHDAGDDARAGPRRTRRPRVGAARTPWASRTLPRT